MDPFASIVAVSPRRDMTLPRIRTVWFMKDSRYCAFMRGVASELAIFLNGYDRPKEKELMIVMRERILTR